MNNRIRQIRESEKKSHTEMYLSEELYQGNSWLKKPIKTIRELIPMFWEHKQLRVLDLGCGVGRNCISIAEEYANIDCLIEAVDILDLAIEKLNENAKERGVQSKIHGMVSAIEDFRIKNNTYDFIIAVSALEHVESERMFTDKLSEIRDGIRDNGIICLVVNSEVCEKDKETGGQLPAQFEVNLSTEQLQQLLTQTFEQFTILKSTVSKQQYDIPRECGIVDLTTNVVTLVAKR